MTELNSQANQSEPEGKLAEFFAKINMSELPAMSNHVHELISLTHSNRSAAYELSKVILKDYSLTNKVLQVVNSAFYSLGRPVSSISRAVTVLGFDSVRELATAIALFEDFIKAGVEKESISKLLTKAFLSAVQAQDLVMKKNIKVLPEEAFICSLLHSLGKILTCIYAPDMHREIEQRVEDGEIEEAAARAVLGDFTYQELGEEVAKFWNLGDKVIECMNPDPPEPNSKSDANGMLRNISCFSNSVINSICDGQDLEPVMSRFGKMFSIDRDGIIETVMMSVENSEDISDSIRYGLSKLKIRSRTKAAQRGEIKKEKNKTPEKTDGADQDEETVSKTKGKGKEKEALGGLDELPVSKNKSVNDYIHDLTETLMGRFNINDFYANLLEALYRGIGFDRVILGIISIQPSKIALIGRFGLGDIEPDKVGAFEHPLNSMNYAIPIAIKSAKDMVIPPEKPHAFPDNLQFLVKNRTVYLFPICLDKKPIGLLYLDRKKGRPKLDQNSVKSVRLLRDFAVMAIRKIRKK